MEPSEAVGDDDHEPVSLAQGEDLEALLHNLQLTEWSSRSHFRSLIGELYSEPPLTTNNPDPKVGILENSRGSATFQDIAWFQHNKQLI